MAYFNHEEHEEPKDIISYIKKENSQISISQLMEGTESNTIIIKINMKHTCPENKSGHKGS